MKRRWQVFVAPGAEAEPLPTAPSPWHDGRWVRIPREHFEAIVEFGEHSEPAMAEKLRVLAWSPDRDSMDTAPVSTTVIHELSDWIDVLVPALKLAEPLAPAPTDDMPDAYGNDEHARMLLAIKAALDEAERLKKPLRSWID